MMRGSNTKVLAMPVTRLKCQGYKPIETTLKTILETKVETKFEPTLEEAPLEKATTKAKTPEVSEQGTDEESSDCETNTGETSGEEETSDEETIPAVPVPEKATFKITSELRRRLQRLEELNTFKRRFRKAKPPKPRKKRAIRPSVTDTIIEEDEYVEPDAATLDRLIMKTTGAKTVQDNKGTDEQRERGRRQRRQKLEGAGLMLDPGDDTKVHVYVDFVKDECRNLEDPQEVLIAAYGPLIQRESKGKYANPTEQPGQGMTRVGLVVTTESERPEDVFRDAVKAVDYLRFTHEFKDMDYPIGYENVTLSLIHHGFPANGAVPSSVGKGFRLYED